jgi:hypothetical protein
VLLQPLGCSAENEPETSYYVPNSPQETTLGKEGARLLQQAIASTCKGALKGVNADDFSRKACLESKPSLVFDNLGYYSGSVRLQATPGCGLSAAVQLSSAALTSVTTAYFFLVHPSPIELCSKTFLTVAVWVDRGEGFNLEGFTAAVGMVHSATNSCHMVSLEGGAAVTELVSAQSDYLALAIHDDPTIERLRFVLGGASGCDPVELAITLGTERTVYEVGDNAE